MQRKNHFVGSWLQYVAIVTYRHLRQRRPKDRPVSAQEPRRHLGDGLFGPSSSHQQSTGGRKMLGLSIKTRETL